MALLLPWCVHHLVEQGWMVSPASSISRRSHHMAVNHARVGARGGPPHSKYRVSSTLMASEIRTSGALVGGPSPRMQARTQSSTSKARVSDYACPRRRRSFSASQRYELTVLYLAAKRHTAPNRILNGVSG